MGASGSRDRPLLSSKHLAPVAISLTSFRRRLAARPGNGLAARLGVGCVDISRQPLRTLHAGSAGASQPRLQVFHLLFPEL